LEINVLIGGGAKTGDFLAYLRCSWRMEVFSMEEEDTREYEVLVNVEEQYSLWLAGQAVPNGWRQVGPRGKKQVCLDYVKEVWTDMRPLSVRKAMEAHAKAQEEAKARQAQAGGEANTPADAEAANGDGARPPTASSDGAGAGSTA
jgi:MbtH protein